MAHHIHALILSEAALDALHRSLPAARAVALTASLSLVPITDGVLDSAGLAHHRVAGFEKLSTQLEKIAVVISRQCAVAYVETEYFGGGGTQAAALWRDGEPVLRLTHTNERAINLVLRELGVQRDGSSDEFEIAGLQRHRSDEGWARDGKGRGTPEPTR